MTLPTVFISYSSEDEPFVVRLATYLEERCQGAIAFFMAGRDLAPGGSWEEEILSSLSEANLVFAVFSAKALESSWVIFEAGYARGLGKPVIPLALPGQTVAAIPRPIGSLQGYNLHNATGLERVIGALNLHFHHRRPETVSNADFQQVLTGRLQPKIQGKAPLSGNYHVYSKSSGEERCHEPVIVQLNGERMTAETDRWESTGHFVEGRYVGRFKYHRGSSPADLGTHEFHWTGEEFVGRAQGDSDKWKNETLVWRPDESV